MLELLLFGFAAATGAAITSSAKTDFNAEVPKRGAFAPTQYREYEEEPQVQRAYRQPQPQHHGGGEVHVQRKGGHYFVQAQIADVTFLAMIDSGASACIISHKVMRELGVDLRGIRWNSEYSTADGRGVRAITVPLDLNVMGIERQGVACAIMENDSGKGPSANLIGMSFISTLSRCDPRGNTLIMAG